MEIIMYPEVVCDEIILDEIYTTCMTNASFLLNNITGHVKTFVKMMPMFQKECNINIFIRIIRLCDEQETSAFYRLIAIIDYYQAWDEFWLVMDALNLTKVRKQIWSTNYAYDYIPKKDKLIEEMRQKIAIENITFKQFFELKIENENLKTLNEELIAYENEKLKAPYEKLMSDHERIRELIFELEKSVNLLKSNCKDLSLQLTVLSSHDLEMKIKVNSIEETK